jgi:hypothetical protein
MRFVFRNTVHPLRIAKKLQSVLQVHGIRKRKTEAMEIVAAMFGYANWHELQKSAREQNEPSKWDDEAGVPISRARSDYYATAIVEMAGLDRELAAEIVDRLAPSARKTRPSTQEPWRALLTASTAGRFLQFDPTSSRDEVMQWEAEKDGFYSKHSLLVSHSGDEYQILLSLSGDHDTESAQVRVRDVLCYLVRDREILGVLAASVISVGESTSKREFFVACDLVSADEPKVASVLCDDPDFDVILANGGIVTMVFDWEVAISEIGSGLGRAFMDSVGAALQSHIGESDLVTVTLDPLQYSAVSLNERLNMRDYRAARKHLASHMVAAFPIRAFGSKARYKPIECQPVFTEDEEAESLYLLKFFLEKHAAVAPGRGESLAVLRGALSPELNASNQPETLTDKRQPSVIEPGLFPVDFDVQWAATALSFGPHRDLWRHMPDDLRRITVVYRSGMKQDERHDSLDRLVFDFANGTSFELERAFLLGGDLYSKYPPLVKTGSGMALKLNPFTDRYSVSDMFGVLKVNSMLIFRGDFGGPLVWPVEPTVIDRT